MCYTNSALIMQLLTINDYLGSTRTTYPESETRGPFITNGEQLFETTGTVV